jgi:hypothetical protein
VQKNQPFKLNEALSAKIRDCRRVKMAKRARRFFELCDQGRSGGKTCDERAMTIGRQPSPHPTLSARLSSRLSSEAVYSCSYLLLSTNLSSIPPSLLFLCPNRLPQTQLIHAFKLFSMLPLNPTKGRPRWTFSHIHWPPSYNYATLLVLLFPSFKTKFGNSTTLARVNRE